MSSFKYCPLVSIIIPNYCHAKYLDQRIQSVLNQTYQNFEVIILDDASPDDGASKNVIRKYRDNPHVSHIVYNEVNSGSTFKQWHKGFELAKGEYIWIAESDDYCVLNLLEELVYLIEKYQNVSIATCRSQFVNEDGELIKPIFQKSKEIKLYDGRDFIRERMLHGNAIYNASSAIFKKDIALSINPQYMKYIAAGDRLFWIELAEKGNVIYSEAPLNYFRQHQNKVSPKKLRDGTTSMEDFKIVRYLERNGHIRFFERFIVRDLYINDIYSMPLGSEVIFQKLIKLWTFNGHISQKKMWNILNLYYKYSNKGIYHKFE